MSNEMNVNRGFPTDTSEVNYSGMMKSSSGKSANSEMKVNSVWEHPAKTAPTSSQPVRNKKQSSSSSSVAQRLHSKWQTVMEEESKVKQHRFKCDPNISVKFFDEITKIAKNINCNPEDLAAIIYKESHFDPRVKSSSGKYSGLIQMDKMTFDSLEVKNKCTYREYCRLPREKQLKYTEAYLKFRIDEKGLKGKRLSGGQIYTLIRRPADINKPSTVRAHQRSVDDAKKVPAKMKKLNTKM